MKHSGYFTVESKCCAGVRFTLKKMTVRRRGRLEDLQAPIEARMKPLREELRPLAKEYRDAVESVRASGGFVGSVDTAGLPRALELKRQIARIDQDELTPAAVGFVLEAIDGLDIEDEPATLELLLEHGPDELYAEIAAAVARELGLLVEERENLQSPSTSAGAVDGMTAPGSAGHVERPDTIISEGALSSTDLESAAASITPSLP